VLSCDSGSTDDIRDVMTIERKIFVECYRHCCAQQLEDMAMHVAYECVFHDCTMYYLEIGWNSELSPET